MQRPDLSGRLFHRAVVLAARQELAPLDDIRDYIANA
jgi:hypothetical protein